MKFLLLVNSCDSEFQAGVMNFVRQHDPDTGFWLLAFHQTITAMLLYVDRGHAFMFVIGNSLFLFLV